MEGIKRGKERKRVCQTEMNSSGKRQCQKSRVNHPKNCLQLYRLETTFQSFVFVFLAFVCLRKTGFGSSGILESKSKIENEIEREGEKRNCVHNCVALLAGCVIVCARRLLSCQKHHQPSLSHFLFLLFFPSLLSSSLSPPVDSEKCVSVFGCCFCLRLYLRIVLLSGTDTTIPNGTKLSSGLGFLVGNCAKTKQTLIV